MAMDLVVVRGRYGCFHLHMGHRDAYIHIWICLYVYVCVCMCICLSVYVYICKVICGRQTKEVGESLVMTTMIISQDRNSDRWFIPIPVCARVIMT